MGIGRPGGSPGMWRMNGGSDTWQSSSLPYSSECTLEQRSAMASTLGSLSLDRCCVGPHPGTGLMRTKARLAGAASSLLGSGRWQSDTNRRSLC